MTRRADTPGSRADFHAATGVLLVTREPAPLPPAALRQGQPQMVAGNPLEGVEILIAVWDDGSVTALNGHVDLGTGIRTALAQIVAEELDIPLERINMVLGDTARAPNQGATIASASIQVHAIPLRAAAAQARATLLDRAARALDSTVAELSAKAGEIWVTSDPRRRCRFGDVLLNQHLEITLALDTPVKPPADYRLVGTSVPRMDIPAKARGEAVFVHDMRLPGMLHGRVVRPPYAGVDQGEFIGNSLEAVDESSIAHIAGIRAVVVIRDFVGIVAEREEDAERALAALRISWKSWPGVPLGDDLESALRANPARARRLVDEGDVDSALNAAGVAMPRTYVWPYQMHASLGPSCAVAHWHDADSEPAGVTVWAGTQNPHILRADLALLLDLADTQVEIVRMEAAGCYGRNCADDVAADAALLSRAVGAPVRVQLTREQENLWEPKGAAQLMQVNGGLNRDGTVAAYDFQTSYPSNGAPTLALLLTRTIEPSAQAYEMGDRTARPPYHFTHLRVTVHDMPPILRASWLRGVAALPNSFAHESYIDELAFAAGVDPLEFRLRHLKDPRAAELLEATAERAGWIAHTAPRLEPAPSRADVVRGQGIAYARYSHGRWPGTCAAWAAWVADVEVNRLTGEVHVSRVVVGHDAGLLVNPAGVAHQIHGNVIQTTSRAVLERVDLEPAPARRTLSQREWGSYPILSFPEVPVIEVVTMARPDEPPLGVGESASVPGTAAIANAIFDATGVRLREPPFTPEVVLGALRSATGQEQAGAGDAADDWAMRRPPRAPQATPGRVPGTARWPRGRRLWSRGLALAAGAALFGVNLLGWRGEIAPVARADPSLYTAATLERGRQLAAAGDCAVCHTAAEGARNAGGRAIQTPFGVIYSTNITPDPATGLGHWPLSAFIRAMREGISRDGHHLYPAFPYTAFARMSDDDLTALYAYLMAQPAVAAKPAETALAFPLNLRPLLALWKGLFHDSRPFIREEDRSPEWNRGAYLVNGAGHCGGCHTPRNPLGAERTGRHFLGGAVIDGWEAPALTALSKAPVPWSREELYRYLREGTTRHHGPAAGPMGPVVRELRAVPDSDIRAMATYLASFSRDDEANATAHPDNADKADEAAAARVITQSREAAATLLGPGQRLFEGACGACHHEGDGPRLIGLNLSLSLNSNLHSTRPDNLLRTILDGLLDPVHDDIGFMPAFRDALNDRQLVELARYMRARFAPAQDPWPDLERAVSEARPTD